uniref:E3 ubiquitin-protein ligase MSL2-like n=1 Tax=Crassostrea virginica TaxID=6565 RepID=A0A8B8EP90_CRAVI|nr:E3 ubiquitin-protein ligase MSL2-like [Crassostrea virginica]
MNPVSVYVATCRYVMSARYADRDTWVDLYRYLPYLRQTLGCYVCRNLAVNPHSASHKNCQHFVCKDCIGGKMKLKPQCSWCKRYDGFVENTQLRIVILGFKRICHVIHSSPIMEALKETSLNGENDRLLKIIEEGITFEDSFSMCSPIPLPPVLMPSQPSIEKKSTEIPKADLVPPLPSTSETTMEEEDNLSPPILEKSEEVDQELEINVDVETHELSPTTSEELIDVCKLPSPNEQESNSLKRKREPVLTFGAFQNTKLLEHRLLAVNCIGPKGGNLKISSTPIVDMSVKKSKHSNNATEIKICKCGRGGTNSRLTCLGQRCPCYIKKLPCINCKCRGCRNPRKATSTNSELLSSNSNFSNSSSTIDTQVSPNENICVV